ncbi:hypothetical protein ACFVZW_27410, partial [Streptomyces sp. NPDC059567]|uniref:hypothetical protein n=1 Tax=Streptomyces sp. NPDC059567 TaxID=3346867 RepID=UPI0036770783
DRAGRGRGGPAGGGGRGGGPAAGRAARGPRAVLCTCSTIGGVAERSAAELGVPVLRVDRPMAAEAVGSDRIVVVATVESTLAPTLDLLREESGDRTSFVTTLVVDGAWERFEAGDRDGYLDTVAAALDRIPADGGVVVLAQASMADAAERTTTPLSVLSSPRLGLAAAATAVRRHG